MTQYLNKRMLLGKSTEQLVISALLDDEREVYVPVVDDHGVDILVRSKSEDTNFQYQEIQVKSLSKGGLFAAITCPRPAPNYWFVFYVKDIDTMWLINSEDFVKIASLNVTGKNIGKRSLQLAYKGKIRPQHAQYIIKKDANTGVYDFSRLP